MIPTVSNDCSVQSEVTLIEHTQQSVPMEIMEDFNNASPQLPVDTDESNCVLDICSIEDYSTNLNPHELTICEMNDSGGVACPNDDVDGVIVLDPNIYYVVGENGEIIVGSSSPVEAMSPEIQEHFHLMESSSVTEQIELEQYISSTLAANTMVPPKVNLQGSILKCKPLKRKGQAEDLTSTSYRKQLREASASKLIKCIKKKGRKRIVAEDPTDSLCPICSTVNGDGWSNCSMCLSWFHEECNFNSSLICNSCG